MYQWELIEQAEKTSDFSELEAFADRVLAKRKQDYQPYEESDAAWRRWNNLPWYARWFTREPRNLVCGRNSAAEELMVAMAFKKDVSTKNIESIKRIWG